MEYSENFNFALPSRDNDIDLADINEIANNFRKIDEKAVKKEDIDVEIDVDILDPIHLKGAELENYYDPDNNDFVDGKFISIIGDIDTNANYCYFKVKVLSGKTYSINQACYSVYCNDKKLAEGNARTFTVPETEKKIVDVYISMTKANFNNGIIIVEGTTAPTGKETDKVYLKGYVVDNIVEDPTVGVLSPLHIEGAVLSNYYNADNNKLVDGKYISLDGKELTHAQYCYFKVTLHSGKTYNVSQKCYSVFCDNVCIASGSVQTFTVPEKENALVDVYISMMKTYFNQGVNITGVEAETDPTIKAHLKGYSVDINYFPSHWNGKKIATIGDSITYGTPSGVTPEDGTRISPNFADIVSGNLNMELLNTAQPGATVKDALGVGRDTYNNQVQQVIAFAPDVVTVMLGANDASTATRVELGKIDDVYDTSNVTFYAGFGEIINQIQTALPSTTIIAMSTPKNKPTSTENMKNYWRAVEEVAEKYDVLFCDLYNICGFNLNNASIREEFAITDGQIHPNYKAHKVIGSRLTGFIASH